MKTSVKLSRIKAHCPVKSSDQIVFLLIKTLIPVVDGSTRLLEVITPRSSMKNKKVVARVHYIYKEGEYPMLYCSVKTHCVVMLCNNHHHHRFLSA